MQMQDAQPSVKCALVDMPLINQAFQVYAQAAQNRLLLLAVVASFCSLTFQAAYSAETVLYIILLAMMLLFVFFLVVDKPITPEKQDGFALVLKKMKRVGRCSDVDCLLVIDITLSKEAGRTLRKSLLHTVAYMMVVVLLPALFMVVDKSIAPILYLVLLSVTLFLFWRAFFRGFLAFMSLKALNLVW